MLQNMIIKNIDVCKKGFVNFFFQLIFSTHTFLISTFAIQSIILVCSLLLIYCIMLVYYIISLPSAVHKWQSLLFFRARHPRLRLIENLILWHWKSAGCLNRQSICSEFYFRTHLGLNLRLKRGWDAAADPWFFSYS